MNQYRPYLLLLIIFTLSTSTALGEVALRCNKDLFEEGKFLYNVKSFAKPIDEPYKSNDESYMKINLSDPGIDIFIQFSSNNKNETTREILAALCAYYDLSTVKIPRIGFTIEGEINERQTKLVQEMLRGIIKARTDSKRSSPIYIMLDSPGGDIYAAMEIGLLLSNNKDINTMVDIDKTCSSSCVLIFAAGDRKGAIGKIGIHRIRFTDETIADLSKDDYIKRYDSAMKKVVEYLKKMGINPSLGEDMMRHTSDDIHYLTKEEITHYGLNQRNPYFFEQKKSKLIAKCGDDWYKLKISLDDLANQKCSHIESTDDRYDCYSNIYRPLNKMCN